MVKEEIKINGLTVEEDLKRIDNLIQRAKNFLVLEGESEPVMLDEWLTIKKYCERFDIKDTHIVTNWIRRGTIPHENVKVVEELNGLRLVKAVPYNV